MIPKVLVLVMCSASVVVANSIFRRAFAGRLVWRGDLPLLLTGFLSAFAEPLTWVGVVAFVFSNALWLVVLSTQQLALAFPIQIGLVLAFNTAVSVVVFSDRLTPTGYVGLITLFVGMVLLWKGVTPAGS